VPYCRGGIPLEYIREEDSSSFFPPITESVQSHRLTKALESAYQCGHDEREKAQEKREKKKKKKEIARVVSSKS